MKTPPHDKAKEPQSQAKHQIEELNDASDVKIFHVEVSKLRNNRLNSRIYDEKVNAGLCLSVEEKGVLVPIRITSDGLIIDGHQRVAAAKETGFARILAIVEDVVPEHQMKAILDYDRMRDKTIVERICEFREYLKIYKPMALARAGTRTDLVTNLASGDKEFGKSRDSAGKMVGMSGASAIRGLQILEEIEKRETAAEFVSTDELRKALNKSVNGAFKLANKYGWLDSATKRREKIASAGDKQDESSRNGSEGKQVELPAVHGWIDDLSDDWNSEQLGDEGQQTLAATLKVLRPAIYLEVGTKRNDHTPLKLRRIARILTLLADKCEM